ncbi:unnamed protein product [Phytomonas sp. EM1]|nr:unnamed protein product [Phytomonas sp. EM1]|eukprot:CCW65351.1 unnamed protein product [Phytomonas sp. isolate EM1]
MFLLTSSCLVNVRRTISGRSSWALPDIRRQGQQGPALSRLQALAKIPVLQDSAKHRQGRSFAAGEQAALFSRPGMRLAREFDTRARSHYKRKKEMRVNIQAFRKFYNDS